MLARSKQRDSLNQFRRKYAENSKSAAHSLPPQPSISIDYQTENAMECKLKHFLSIFFQRIA